MPEQSTHSSDQKRRHRRSRERARSPFEEDEGRSDKKRSRRKHAEPDGDAEINDSVPQGGSDISLSIKETNALRAKLGLAPLETDENQAKDEDRIVDNQSENYVHAPAKDLRQARATDSIKERLTVQKEKRMLYDKYSKSRLYEPEEKDMPVTSWIDKLREKERTKKQAQERAKLLSEMDEQFDSPGPEEPTTRSLTQTAYRPDDLSGIKVEHKIDRFAEGRSVILTLKDKGVLEEDDSDVLINVNLLDEEKAEINRENLRKTAGLAGIADQEDEDVLLGLRHKDILSKYDVEIKGAHKDQFTLGEAGVYNPESERMLRQLQEELRAGKQSLPDTELRVASEYYTEDELKAKFKKRKKRVKPRTRTELTADDLVPEDELRPEASVSDLGSRAARVDKSAAPADEKSSVPDPLAAITAPALHQNNPSSDPLEDLSREIIEEDELRGDIEKTIQRVIKYKSTVYVKPEEVAGQLLARERDPRDNQSGPSRLPDPQNDSSGVIFDSTAEFYKSIGAGFQESMRQNARLNQLKRDVSDDEDQATAAPFYPPVHAGTVKAEPMSTSDSESEPGEERSQPQAGSSNRWHTVGEDVPGRRQGSSKNRRPSGSNVLDEEDLITGVLDDEPRLDSGVFSALKLAEKKGYIEKGKEKQTGTGTMVNLMAKHFVQEDVRYDDIDAKFAKRDRYSGPLSEFKELKNFRPDVKLEYVDELGRQLNAKEAFRQLSHKFHGKGSGKNKTEKRMKKIKEEFLLKASTSSDTPLGTAEKLNKKLESISLPYVILSGKNAAVKNLTK